MSYQVLPMDDAKRLMFLVQPAPTEDVKKVWDTVIAELETQVHRFDKGKLPPCSELALRKLIQDNVANLMYLTFGGLATRHTSGLTSLPEAMQLLTGLKVLFLHNCPLTEIPDWIGTFAQLGTFNLSGAATTLVPDSVTNLKHVESFTVAGKAKLTSNKSVVEQSAKIQEWAKSNNIRFRVVS